MYACMYVNMYIFYFTRFGLNVCWILLVCPPPPIEKKVILLFACNPALNIDELVKLVDPVPPNVCVVAGDNNAYGVSADDVI